MLLRNIQKKGPLLIGIAAILWAFDGILRRSLYSLNPLIIVFGEHAVGAVLLVPVLWKKKSNLFAFRKGELLSMFWISLFSGLLGTLWFTTALLQTSFISFSVVFLLQKTQPIFAVISARILLKEKISRRYLFWAGVAMIAAFFVTFPNGKINFETGSGTVFAGLYALGAAFAWGSSTAFSKRALQGKDSTVITGMRFFFTTVLAFVGVLLFQKTTQLTHISPIQFSTFVGIALSTGMVALWIYYKGLSQTEVKTSTIVELLFPVSAVFLDAIVYHSFLSPSQYLATIVLLFASTKISYLHTQKFTFITTQIRGKGRGKKIGVPTINLKIPTTLTLKEGVYSSSIVINNRKYDGALHYGSIPTFHESQKNMEVHLINTTSFSEVITETTPIQVKIQKYIRPIQFFENTHDLVKQIQDDIALITDERLSSQE